MFESVLKEIREKVRTRTLHAEEEMNDDGLAIFDVEHCLLTGEIIERQKDRRMEISCFWGNFQKRQICCCQQTEPYGQSGMIR